MPVVWDVQPYRLITEMRNNYMQFMVTTTTKAAHQIRPQAEAWMKKKAPWNDITGDARESLSVTVVKTAEAELQDMRDKAAMTNAYWQDRDKIGAINAEKSFARESLSLEYAPLFEQADDKEVLRLGRELVKKQTSARMRPITSLPKNQSAVEAVRKEQARRISLVELRFGYDMNLTYALWLEVANQGRYAILSQASHYWGQKLTGKIRQLGNLVQYTEDYQNAFNTAAAKNQESQASKFEKFVRREERLSGERYIPWSPEKQARRIRDRKRYRRDKAAGLR